MEVIKLRLKINKPTRGYIAGREITVEVDANGVLLDSYWKRVVAENHLESDGIPRVEIVFGSSEKASKKIEAKNYDKGA